VHKRALGRHASLHACNVVVHVMITKGLFSSDMSSDLRRLFPRNPAFMQLIRGVLGVDDLLLSLCSHHMVLKSPNAVEQDKLSMRREWLE